MPPQRTRSSRATGIRRPHTKSHDGCKNCRRRRVKCDETHPVCGSCSRLKMRCDFSGGSPGSDISSSTLGASSPEELPLRRGRPLKDWDFLIKPDPGGDSLHEEQIHIDVNGIELFHHFMVHAYLSIAPDQPFSDMWRIEVPKIGLKFPGVTHLLYSFSALSLSRLDESRKTHFVRLAEQHHSVGVRKTSELVANLSEDNCQALWVSALLVCYYTFAKGPRPGDYLIFNEYGSVDLWPLLKGVRSINAVVGSDKLYCGPLAAMRGDAPEEVTKQNKKKPLRNWIDWETPFEYLHREIANSEIPEKFLFLEALDRLGLCYSATYGRKNKPPDHDSLDAIVFRWLYMTDDKFVKSLESKEPFALIIIAYYCPLINTIEDCWFMEGWADHILLGVYSMLNAEQQVWLDWPMQQMKTETDRIDTRII